MNINTKRKIRRLKKDFWFSWFGNVIWYMFCKEKYVVKPKFHNIKYVLNVRNWARAFKFAKDMTR